jgi:hypothetical protein
MEAADLVIRICAFDRPVGELPYHTFDFDPARQPVAA